MTPSTKNEVPFKRALKSFLCKVTDKRVDKLCKLSYICEKYIVKEIVTSIVNIETIKPNHYCSTHSVKMLTFDLFYEISITVMFIFFHIRRNYGTWQYTHFAKFVSPWHDIDPKMWHRKCVTVRNKHIK